MDAAYFDDYAYDYTIKAKVGSDVYRFVIYTTKENYDYINNILINDKEFSSGLSKYKNSNIFGIKYNDGYSREDDNNLSNMIINKYKNDKSIFVGNSSLDDLFDVTLYVYDDFNVRSVNFNVSGNKNLELDILRYYNANTKSTFNNTDILNDIHTYYIGNSYCIYSDEYYNDISKFIVDNIDDKFDIDKEYGYISIYTYNGKNIFVTNKVDELNLLKSKYAYLDTDVAEDEE